MNAEEILHKIENIEAQLEEIAIEITVASMLANSAEVERLARREDHLRAILQLWIYKLPSNSGENIFDSPTIGVLLIINSW